MPGIAGIIGKGSTESRGLALDLMVKCMMHEPFYTGGTFVNDGIGLGIGWACQRGTFSDCMPVWNERQDILLIFSGEDFAGTTAIGELKSRGHKFDPENASYIVHLYEELGLAFLEKLNGLFSGLVADFREGKITLFNDRYGLNRIYFHESEDGFYFSSEAKSLLKVFPHLRSLDMRSLGEFFSCGCVLQNRTLFSGVALLPPGSAWTFGPSEPVKKQWYFSPESWENHPPLKTQEYYERLKETWKQIVRRYFGGKHQIGLSLTGGVDSRMILAWVPSSAGTLPCYTFGSKYRDCADVKISREVARICQQRHETISLGGEFLDQFSVLAERSVYLSDGAVGVGGSVDVYVQKIARQIAPVRVTGTNGGETLRGLVVFKPNGFGTNLLDPELALSTRAASLTYAEELKAHKHSFTAFKQAPWFMGSKFVLERSQVTLRMPYCDNELVALAYQVPSEWANNDEVSRRLIADGNPALGRIRTDRAGSPRSIPGLALAQHLFLEFTYKAEYAYDVSMPQWLARLDRAFAANYLERLFMGRHRIHHFRVWYRDELSEYVKEILLDPRTRNRPYLRGDRLEELVSGHRKGDRNYTQEIHKLLSIELIQRQLIEQ